MPRGVYPRQKYSYTTEWKRLCDYQKAKALLPEGHRIRALILVEIRRQIELVIKLMKETAV